MEQCGVFQRWLWSLIIPHTDYICCPCIYWHTVTAYSADRLFRWYYNNAPMCTHNIVNAHSSSISALVIMHNIIHRSRCSRRVDCSELSWSYWLHWDTFMHYELAMSCDENITSAAQCAYVLYSPNIGCIKTNVLSITFHQVAMCIRPAQKDYSSYVHRSQ